MRAILTDLPVPDARGIKECLVCRSREHPISSVLHRPQLGLRASRPICTVCRLNLDPLLEWLEITSTPLQPAWRR